MGLYDDSLESEKLGPMRDQRLRMESKDKIPTPTPTPQQASWAEAIRRSAGRFFTCKIIKADGTVREMSARYCVARPVKEHRELPGCLTVFVDLVDGWRTIRIDRLTAINIDGKSEEVTL